MFKIIVTIYLITVLNISYGDSAKILAIYPVPCISHQSFFRTLTMELMERGHDITVLTTDPAFPNETAPKNVREIDAHDVSYKLWNRFLELPMGEIIDVRRQLLVAYDIISDIFEKLLKRDDVKKLIESPDEKFDLLVYDGCVIAPLIFSYIYEIPAIAINSLGAIYGNYEAVGAVVNEAYYPSNLGFIRARTQIERLQGLFDYYYNQFYIQRHIEKVQNKAVRNSLGVNMPDVRDLKKNINMMFINLYSAWDSHLPSPISLKYMGGLHSVPEKPLPRDIKSYLDSSSNGVIYMSLGTNVKPSQLPREKMQILAKVFSKLPYDVLWKWDTDTMLNKPKNVKLFKWLPQSDVLKHPNVKLIVTQGGMQSTDEAITAGVPLIGIPMLGDQWFNTEKYVRYDIGLQLDFGTLTEDSLRDAIHRIVGNKSYYTNIVRHRSLMLDQRQKPLDHAVSWIEYTLKHGGSHLRAPAADISWAEYIELELLVTMIVAMVSPFICLFCGLKFVVRIFRKKKCVKKFEYKSEC